MRYSLIFIIVFSINLVKGQNHFVTAIDINNTSQYARQIIQTKNEFVISIQSQCIEENASCGGLLSLDLNGNIKDTLLLKGFSGNLNALLVKNDTFYCSGETSLRQAEAFKILKVNIELNLIDSFNVSNPVLEYFNYFALGSVWYNNKLVVVGTSFCEGCPQSGHLLVLKDNLLDTSLIFPLANPGYSFVNSINVNSKNELVLYNGFHSNTTFEDSISIIRLDSNYKKIFEWKKAVRNSDIPRGFITQNDDMIITVLSETRIKLEDIYSISNEGQTNWVFKWPSQKGTSNILRIKAAKNGEIFVMGQRWYPDYLDDLRNVAFVMRLTNEGKQKWIRHFKLEDQNTLLSNNVRDLIELENGDLLLIGGTERSYYDPLINQDRPDQDIFWARIGGDGCINDDCGEEYIVTSTNEVLQKEKKINIYPNPSISEIVIDLPTKGRIEILDGNGRLIESKQGSLGKNNITLPIDLKGLVFVKCILADGQTYVEKVIKL